MAARVPDYRAFAPRMMPIRWRRVLRLSARQFISPVGSRNSVPALLAEIGVQRRFLLLVKLLRCQAAERLELPSAAFLLRRYTE